MLIIGRKRDQKIVIADNIVITILDIGRNRVRFGIEAPKEVPIHTRLESSPQVESPPSEATIAPSQAAPLGEASKPGKRVAAQGGSNSSRVP